MTTMPPPGPPSPDDFNSSQGQGYPGNSGFGQGGFGQAPPPGGPYQSGPTRPDQMPGSVAMAVNLIWVNIGLSVVSMALTFVFIDQIIERALDDAAGSGVALSESTLRTSVMVGAIFGLVVSIGIAILLLVFIKKGANWARIVQTVFGAAGLVFGLVGILGQPIPLVVCTVVSLVLTAATLYFLWKRDSAPWFVKQVRY